MILRRTLLPAALILVIAATAAPSSGRAATDPVGLIHNLGSQALEVLGNHASPAERQARFSELFHQDFDVPHIARFVLGRYWRVATPEQQQEFVRLFSRYIVLAYGNRLAQYSGEHFKVLGSRPEPDGYIVSSEIIRTDGQPPVKVEWRLTRADGSYKITDVIVEGISMAVTQRSEFASVIRRHGGQVSELLAMLRQKMASAAARD